MSTELFCGCHVLCVDARLPAMNEEPSPLERGRVYVVTGIGWGAGFSADLCVTEGVMLALDGCLHPAGAFGFFASRFRPLDENRVAWAREIAANPPASVDELA